MSDTDFDVIGIGNAIVDVLSHSDDAFLTQHGLTKGSMALIDAAQADHLYGEMGPGVECSGGSAANTIACLANLGAKSAFIGKVKDDGLGKIFDHDIKAAGVDFSSKHETDGPSTARCLILVTDDAQRTMNTFLGACVNLTPDDIDPDYIARGAVTYLEGYLWDPDHAKEAFLKASMAAHKADRQVSLSLSDAFCVDRHRKSFQDLVEHHVDILFANEDEIMALYEVDTFDAALQCVRDKCSVAALTRGDKGSVVIAGNEIHVVDAEKVDHVVDTTGAGDAYAAGFLFGYTQNFDMGTCARLGSVCSAEIISHYGARPEADLADLAGAALES
ncbi:Sugar kinases, ribokinase family [Candidatus Terasakiella magnetica]|uniref:Sugar kinases, ribokinase family n=1 Tax=Candidatus Terasakiella magnetica TaxID=1867952 RepID=A0A1C3RG94_9PROT|nr:adenosine kinase [Candidatus Terasakiella magnetica]SCA56323.1 Sugar kinases, ribokinase family [Candidatus Terasakiella magnetica]